MDFLKKNWVKLVGMLLFMTIGVVALIASIGAMRSVSALGDVNDAVLTVVGVDRDITRSQFMAGLFTYLAIFVSSLAIVTVLVLCMLGKCKKCRNIILVVGSVVALALFITAVGTGSEYLKSLSDARDVGPMPPGMETFRSFSISAARTAYIVQIAQTLTFAIVFAVLPLIYGVKKLVCKGNCDAKGEVA